MVYTFNVTGTRKFINTYNMVSDPKKGREVPGGGGKGCNLSIWEAKAGGSVNLKPA